MWRRRPSFPNNVVEEFGSSSDPFEKWLLAAVLLSRKDEANAAKYYAEAGASGKYPKAYKFAIDIYLHEKRYDQVEAMLSKIASGGGGDAQWAEYVRFSLAHSRWEQGGSKDKALEDQWVKAAQDYVQKYPNGEHIAEMRVQLAGLLQQQNKYAEAAELYSQVKGDPEFTFTAKFKAAECYYAELQGASAKDNKGPKIDTESVRKLTLENINEAIKMGPEAERTASGAGKKTVHEIRGEAIYMLASILEEDPEKVDYAQVATLLNGYESQLPEHEREVPGCGRMAHHGARSSRQVRRCQHRRRRNCRTQQGQHRQGRFHQGTRNRLLEGGAGSQGK